VVHDGKMWVLGGGNYQPAWQVRNDVWCSTDGVHWTEVLAEAPWQPRILVLRGRVSRAHLVLGGRPTANKLLVDVWHSERRPQLVRVEVRRGLESRGTSTRPSCSRTSLWVAGGHAKPLNNEVWSLSLAAGLAPGGMTVSPARAAVVR